MMTLNLVHHGMSDFKGATSLPAADSRNPVCDNGFCEVLVLFQNCILLWGRLLILGQPLCKQRLANLLLTFGRHGQEIDRAAQHRISRSNALNLTSREISLGE